jgi:glutamate/tyrosine decarboxylase-like PLP-dependent enzyme
MSCRDSRISVSPNLDYQLLRLGKAGYRAIMTNLIRTADFLAESIAAIGGGEKFVLMSKTGGEGLPLVAWRLKNTEDYDGKAFFLSFFSTFRDSQEYSEFAIARRLRARGWIVPGMLSLVLIESLGMQFIHMPLNSSVYDGT